jgi:hypothetical protein
MVDLTTLHNVEKITKAKLMAQTFREEGARMEEGLRNIRNLLDEVTPLTDAEKSEFSVMMRSANALRSFFNALGDRVYSENLKQENLYFQKMRELENGTEKE